jgi:hypothetical protein
VAVRFGVYTHISARCHLRLLTITSSPGAALTYARELYAQSPDYGKFFVLEDTTNSRIAFRDLADFKVVASVGEYVR